MDRLYQYPHVNADIECIRKYPGSQLWRMHIARSFTMFYTVIPAIEEIHIDDLMTVEQAYKKYRQ
ncbi:MAG TPA: hypothetical protein VMS89_09705 [Methanoregulaceae archaeon]|nr:hypothetical protein [Methanoregulaceae archaeon]